MKSRLWVLCLKLSILCILLITIVSSVGCGGGGDDDDDDDDGSGGGCIQLSEREPNNDINEASVLGTLTAGACFEVSGDASETSDELDGHTFTLTGPQSITATLTHGSAVNFDLVFFSRNGNQAVAICDALTSPEICIATFRGTSDTLDIIVNAFSGAGSYTLRVEGVVSTTSVASRSSESQYSQNNEGLQHYSDNPKDVTTLLDMLEQYRP